MKRSNIMVKGKRPLESISVADSDDDWEPNRQRPALDRSSPEMAEGPDGRNLRLQFETRLSLPLFKGEIIKGEQGNKINVALLDANSDQVVAAGPESCVKLDVVVLDGDISNEDDDNWTAEKFESRLVKEREGKRPLLSRVRKMTLKEGVGELGDLTFTDNSSWTKSKKFRLGLKVSSGCCEGVRIREAKTEAFAVKERREPPYKKHHPPALYDEVWRLEAIGKDGSYHKRLTENGIHTVYDFLCSNPQRLRNIMQERRRLSNEKWDKLIRHANTCNHRYQHNAAENESDVRVTFNDNHWYRYNAVENESVVSLIFNAKHEFSGLMAGKPYRHADALPADLEPHVKVLTEEAYCNWSCVEECDAEYVSRLKQNEGGDASFSGAAICQQNANYFESQLSRLRRAMSLESDSDPLDPS